MLFVWVILITAVVLSALNCVLSQSVLSVLSISASEGILRTLFAILYVFAVDAILALVIRRGFPPKFFNHQKAIFTVGKGEKKFYEKIGIRKWKDKIPEWGKFTDFSKNKIAHPTDNTYLSRYFTELCYGEAIHLFSAILGFTLIIFVPRKLLLSIALPVALINALCNLPSLFILRYNSYKLEILYKNNEKRAARAAASGKTLRSTYVAETATEEENPVISLLSDTDPNEVAHAKE